MKTATRKDIPAAGETPCRLSFFPKAPVRPEELRIPIALVEDLMLRRLYVKGEATLKGLCRELKLSFPLLHALFQKMRPKQYFEVGGMEGNDYRFTLSGLGREQAAQRFLTCRYIGPAPVSLASYNAAVRSQNIRPLIDRRTLQTALADLVVTEGFLEELGPALISQKSIFLYGPTGNGKTSVVSRLSRIYRDTIVIPYAVEVDGQILVLFDPGVHEQAEKAPPDLDPRWVVCRRPCILVGGELEPRMLELQHEESTQVYAAPVQMRANNGILVIDDFGRQIVSPVFLLNRWIVPLDRHTDYLSLRYGLKFQVPFEVTVVFATNLEPADLADEAFLRRIPNKIRVAAVDDELFERIYAREVERRRLPAEGAAGAYLRELCRRRGGGLRACQPADILDIVVAASEFAGQPPRVTCEALGRAAEIYFTRPRLGASGGKPD